MSETYNPYCAQSQCTVSATLGVTIMHVFKKGQHIKKHTGGGLPVS